MKNPDLDWIDQRFGEESAEDLAQQQAEPADQAAEVVAGGGEDGVGGVAPTVPEIVAAHSVLGFEMADDGLDSGPAAQFTFDSGCHPSLLARDEDPELVIRRCVVAAVSLVGEDARDGIADQRLHVRDHGCQRVAVIRIAGQRFDMGDELATPGVADGGGDGDFDADLWTTPALQ